jgi:hypothetical protein
MLYVIVYAYKVVSGLSELEYLLTLLTYLILTHYFCCAALSRHTVN